MRPTNPARPPSSTAAARLVLFSAVLGVLVSCGPREYAPEDLPLAYRQAEDSFRLGDYQRAVRGYEAFLRRGEPEDLLPRAYYKLALAEFRQGHHAEAMRVLDRMDQHLEGRKFPRVYELRGDIEQARGNPVSALRWWEAAWEESEGEERIDLFRRIRAAIAQLDDSALAPARAVLQTEETQALIDARLRRGDGRIARPAPPRDVPRDDELIRPPADQILPTPRVACLLPLTGSYGVYGQRSLNGIRLALGDDTEQLVVRDTQGRPEIARSAIDELIGNPSIVAVIGPLRSEEAESVAARAERAGLPLFLLAQRDAASGEFVVQPVMTHERQAAQLAEHAVTAMGAARLGVLYPNDGYGTALAQGFENEFTRRGGRIVGMVAYSPGAQEFAVEALSVQKWIDDDALQGVFIPDFAETAFVLAESLRRAHPTLQLLGSNGWNDPGRLGKAGHVLDGAVFVDGFFAASGRPATRDFVAAYRTRFQEEPQILEAQAHDATLLVRQALQGGARSRSQIVPALRRVRTVEGASGTIGIGSQGVQRELFVLRFARGTISELQPGSIEAAPVAEEIPARSGVY